MTKTYAAILLALITHGAAHANEWAGEDKMKHTFGGGAIAAATTMYTGNQAAGFAAGCVVGLAKEVVDATVHTRGDMRDFAVTCLGALIGSQVGGRMSMTPTKGGLQFTARFDF